MITVLMQYYTPFWLGSTLCLGVTCMYTQLTINMRGSFKTS
jgi:hypothetical protein